MDYSIFQKNLTELIDKRYGSQAVFAAKCGFTPAAVSRYCNGIRKPDLESVLKICDAAGVSIEWLLGLDELDVSNGDVEEFTYLYNLANEDDRAIIKAVLKKYRKE